MRACLDGQVWLVLSYINIDSKIIREVAFLAEFTML